MQRKRKSPFIRYFDKTPPGIVCPHYYLLAHANGCPYECAYCYLSLTFRQKKCEWFTNLGDMESDIRAWLFGVGEPSLLSAAAFLWLMSPIAIAIYLSRTGRFAVAHRISAVNFAGLVTYCAWLTGGLSSALLPWLVAVPIEAGLSTDRRSVMWAVGAAGMGLAVLDQLAEVLGRACHRSGAADDGQARQRHGATHRTTYAPHGTRVRSCCPLVCFRGRFVGARVAGAPPGGIIRQAAAAPLWGSYPTPP